LYLPDSGECAVYVPSTGTVPADRYQGEEAEALGFVESMGFILDNLNFRNKTAQEQEDYIKTLPVFQREPPPAVQMLELDALGEELGAATTGGGGLSAVAAASAKPSGGKANVSALGKLLGSFCLAGLVVSGCAHVSDRDREQCQIHADIAGQNIVSSPQTAIKETDEAIGFNPECADAWHYKAIVLQHSFGRLEEAREAYLKALQYKNPFSEARTNLGTLYMDQNRYDDAIHEYEIALNDLLNRSPFIAQANMGWAYFKKGEPKKALEHLNQALSINPKFCMAHLQLGEMFEAQGNVDDACRAFGKYKESCPDAADAYQREGVCLAKQGKKDEALKDFDTCLAKAKVDTIKDQCKTLKGQLSP
jgi:Tfp pilus assembly protein PilF